MAEPSLPRVIVLDLLSVVPAYDASLVTELQASNPSVELAAASPHRTPDYFDTRGLDTNRLIVDWVARMPSRLLGRSAVRRVTKAIEYHLNMLILSIRFTLNPPDAVHVQWLPMLAWSPADMWFVAYLRRRRIPIVYTVHNVLPHDEQDDEARLRYANLYERVSMLICHTNTAKRRLVDEFQIASERIVVIPHGPLVGRSLVDPQDASEVAHVESRGQVVLSVGVIRPYKGLEFLLRSWKLVDVPDATLVIAGGGDPAYLRTISDLASDLGLGDSVDLRLEYVPEAEYEALHLVADVVVLPYREISQSGALMTAMAYGCAVVATDVGGFSEVIESGRNGILVSGGDRDALASAITDILENQDLRTELGDAARGDVESVLSWASIATTTMDTYATAIRMDRQSNTG